jgi:hypothetical protein
MQNMASLLEDALADLPALLASPVGWNGLHIDYERPHVDRAWRSWRDCRISIHRIHPCGSGEAMLHPHQWPSAMAILAGRYAMNVGYGASLEMPQIVSRLILTAGARYEMTNRAAWHDVTPIDGPVLSVMLSGPPWDRAMPIVPTKPQAPLSPTVLAELLGSAQLALASSFPRAMHGSESVADGIDRGM